jgi:hypothetical protein
VTPFGDIRDLVVEGPADVLEVGVVQEVLVELLHPESDLLHADRADLRQRVPKIQITQLLKILSSRWYGSSLNLAFPREV